MSNFSGTILTNLGKQVIAQSLTGKQFEITKVVLGDGIWNENTNPEELTSLISPKLTLPIADKEENGDTVRIRVLLTNEGVTEGFFIRELGVIAEDKTTGEEILYAVAYADPADYLPAGDSSTKVEAGFDIYVVVANSPNITVRVSDTIVLATKQDIEEHNTSAEAHPDIRQLISDIENGNIIVGNADKIDGKDASDLANVDLSNITSLGKILELDGAGSGLDADLVRGLPADFSANLNDTGYQKLPSGVIVQWGVVSYSASDGENGTICNFPIAFPNKCFQIVGTDVYNGVHTVAAMPINNSQFKVWGKDSNGNWSDTGIRFIAIGY